MPNGHTMHENCPSAVVMLVFSIESGWLHPAAKSSAVMWVAPPSLSIKTAVSGSGPARFFVQLSRPRKSVTIRRLPSDFLAKLTPDAWLLWDGFKKP